MRADLSRPLSLSWIEQQLACPPGGAEKMIASVVTDAREADENSLFFALAGERDDGHRYLEQARNAHAAAVVRKDVDLPGAVLLKVPDTTAALGRLAQAYRALFECHCLTVTGSMGKTSTRTFAASLLSACGNVCSAAGNHNNAVGLPMSILSVSEKDNYLLLEAGMNHRGEISYLSRIARPDTAVICAIGSAHIGKLGSIDAVRVAKYEIVDGMSGGTLVLPAEEETLRAGPYPFVRTFSTTDDGADYHIQAEKETGRYLFCAPQTDPLPVAPPEASKLWLLTALRAFALCHAAGADARTLASALPSCHLPPKRQQILEKDGVFLIDDAYNASPESVLLALDRLRKMSVSGRKYVLLGDMLELGDFCQFWHEKAGRAAADCAPAELWLTGESAGYTKRGACQAGFSVSKIRIWPADAPEDDLPRYIRQTLSPGDVLLVKGAHASGLWRLSGILGFGGSGV